MRSASLSAEERQTYERDGLVVPAWRLPEETLARVRSAVDDLLDARPNIRPEFVPLPHVAWDDSPRAKSIAHQFLGFATDPAILDLVEDAIGPDIIFWTAALFCKPALTGAEVPWHQDGQYWPIRPPATCTVWIALDAATPENGCMRYVPGSHNAGYFRHTTDESDGLALNQRIDDPAFDESAAAYDALEAGQISLHDVHLVHGSSPNRSDKRRAGMTFRYMPSTSHYDRDIAMGPVSGLSAVEFKKRPIWLVRGVDRCGRNDFTVGHDGVDA